MDVMFAQDLLDRLDACRNRGLVVGGAVLAKEVFEHIGGNNGIPFTVFTRSLRTTKPAKCSLILSSRVDIGTSEIEICADPTFQQQWL